jgi:hypothetical protein
MGIQAWLALVGCIIAGGAATLVWARRAGVVHAAAVGLAVQGVLTLGLYLTVGLWAPDAGAYDELGRQFAAYWSGGPAPAEVGEGKEAFPVMLGAIYFVVGPAPAIGLVLNWAAHGLLVPALATLATRLDLPTRTTAWAVALFPPLLLWSSFLLRESISWLLMAVFLLALVGLARKITLAGVIVMATSLAALLWFRGTAAIILAGVGMGVLVLSARRSSILPRLGLAMLALLVLSPRLADLLAGYVTVGDLGAKRSDLSSTADTTTFGGESAAEAGQASSFVDSILRVAFGPYPWEWPALGAPFAFDGLLWLTVIALTAIGWWKASNRVELLLVVLPALAISAALMLTSGNYGTMQRLRVQTSVLLLPVAAAGFTLVFAWTRSRVPVVDRLASASSRSDTSR